MTLTNTGIPHAGTENHPKEEVSTDTLVDCLDDGPVEFGFAESRDKT